MVRTLGTWKCRRLILTSRYFFIYLSSFNFFFHFSHAFLESLEEVADAKQAKVCRF